MARSLLELARENGQQDLEHQYENTPDDCRHIAGALAAGCASHHYQSAVSPAAAATSEKAYLYGRFKVEREVLLATQLSLQVVNAQTGRDLGLRFRSSAGVYAVAVPPGDYQLAHLILGKAGPNLELVGDYRRLPLSLTGDLAALAKPFRVGAGKAYHLSDFCG